MSILDYVSQMDSSEKFLMSLVCQAVFVLLLTALVMFPAVVKLALH